MLNLSDIHPLSEFQKSAKAFLAKLKETKTPIVLTVNGKASAVIQDAESYQQLLDRLELLESVTSIQKSLEEFEKGEGIPLKEAFQQLKEKSEETEIRDNLSNGQKMANALRKIANHNNLADINPQIWQQETRCDRTLPKI